MFTPRSADEAGPDDGLAAHEPEGVDAPVAAAPRPRPPRRPGRTRVALTLVLGLLLTVAVALVATVLLDASAWPHPVLHLRTTPLASPTLVQSTAVVWVLVVTVVALVGRLWLGLGVVTALVVLVGFVNATKLELRNDPVLPGDVVFLGQPDFLVQMVPVRSLVLGGLGLVAVVLVAAAVGWLVSRVLPRLTRHASRRRVWTVRVARLVVLVLGLVALTSAGDFNERANPWRAAFEATGLRWRSWDQRVNYQQNGFVAGLLFNTHVTAMPEPPGYSRAAVEAVARRWEERAEELNRGRTGSLDGTNVVTVLSESFSQPAWLRSVGFGQDLIPRTTATMRRTVSGKMLAPGFGSGTANTEFELLTGQSLSQLSPQLSIPYEQLVSHYKTFPSAVGWFRAHGHDTVAIHPFEPRMYARTQVYDAFGFSRFITKTSMTYRAREGGRFIDDRAAFKQVLKEIDDHDKPVMAHLVTMQNHMPYDDQYDDPIPPTRGFDAAYAKVAGQYARGLARTDQALAELMTKLEASPEPTVVVFYGDHLPPEVYPQSLVRTEGVVRSHQTPFLIWSNRTPLRHTALPTTSPTQFLPMLFDAMDVPLPPWYALLHDLRQHVPAMDTGVTIDAQDRRVKVSQLDPAAKQVLADYRMVQYDLSVGKRWSERTMMGDAPAAGSAARP